jgi:pyruvate dehydrogenase (quinone)
LEDPSEVEDGIRAAFAHDGPVIVDAVVARTELPLPPAINLQMAKGFTLYMLKAVFSGKGDQLIDLAETNLWH